MGRTKYSEMVLNAKFSNKKSFLAFLHIHIFKIESTLYFWILLFEPCPNTLVWSNFWIGQKHFWTYRRMGHVCAVCHNRAKCFHEDWSRIWISLKVNKSNIVFVFVSSPQTQPKFLRYSFRYNFVMMRRQKIWFQINLPLHRWFHEIFLYRLAKNHENIRVFVNKFEKTLWPHCVCVIKQNE